VDRHLALPLLIVEGILRPDDERVDGVELTVWKIGGLERAVSDAKVQAIDRRGEGAPLAGRGGARLSCVESPTAARASDAALSRSARAIASAAAAATRLARTTPKYASAASSTIRCLMSSAPRAADRTARSADQRSNVNAGPAACSSDCDTVTA
jgi:hypothetical protein